MAMVQSAFLSAGSHKMARQVKVRNTRVSPSTFLLSPAVVLTRVRVNAASAVLHVHKPGGLLSVRAVPHFESKNSTDFLHKLLPILEERKSLHEERECVPLWVRQLCFPTFTSCSFLLISWKTAWALKPSSPSPALVFHAWTLKQLHI